MYIFFICFYRFDIATTRTDIKMRNTENNSKNKEKLMLYVTTENVLYSFSR